MAIQDYKVSENYTGRDISSLSDRPNEDGLTAQQLKARFDQLNKEVIPNYNDLIDALDVILTNDSEDISALYALVEDHEGRLSIVEATLPNKSDVGHNHDERYYTESESDALLSGKSNVGHTHDDRYYTESEIDSKFSANSTSDRARANHTGTQSADTIVDGTTNKSFLATERTKLSGIQTGAEVNQNAFSNIQVGSTQIQADQKTDTLTFIAGTNITLTPNATNDSITISATGELAVTADNVFVEDIGEYYSGNNVEEILQEVGSALQNISSDAEDVSITDAGDYFVSDNVEGALQEVGADLLDKMNLDGSNSLIDELTFIGNGVLSYDADRQMLQYQNTDGTTNDIGAEVWFSEGKASGAISNGSPVQFAGVQGDHYLFKTAVPSEINANPNLFMGIATSNIANNAWGKVTHFGVVHDVNTNGWSAGTILWFDSVNGGLTSTKPSYPNAQIQVCAVVVQNNTVGSVIVRPTVYQDAYTHSEVDTLLSTKPTELTTTETITVGTGGQYATINAALAYATKKYPTYVSASTRPRITISLLSGFVMAEQVIVDGIDLSWITISSVSAEVVIQRSALTTANADGSYPAFTAQNGAFLPIINTLFNMDTSGTETSRHGIMVRRNSRAIILSGKGVKNAARIGLSSAGSSLVEANGANFSGAGSYGIYAENGSTINAQSANASYASTSGVYANNASTIEFASGNAQRAGYNTSDVLVNANADGIVAVYASTINAGSSNASNSARYGVYAYFNSRINFNGGTATNTGSHAVYARYNSIISAQSSNCLGASIEYIVNNNSFIDIQSATGGVDCSPTLNSYTPQGLITNNAGVITTNGNAKTVTYTATIPSASWTGSSAPFSKAVTVSGITSTDNPIIDIVQTGTYATDQAMVTNWALIYRAVTSADTITFYSTAVPSADIPIQVKVVK